MPVLICSTLDSSKALSYSAPSAINLEHFTVKFDTEHESLTDGDHETSQESIALENTVLEANGASHEWQSLSCLTDSTEQSVPINFDMSNRAKLPRGIDKIRPHIENIDNVPLLVSLFTDCTASSTKEMIRIMQDYGEIICVIGSSANYEATGIFVQADASIAIEPLYPQVCQRVKTAKPVKKGFISPIDLSRYLNSVACSLSIKREDPLSIAFLIVEARHYMDSMWNAVQFWLCSCTAVSVIQLLSALLILPAIFSTGQVLWICCIIIPILSISLMGVEVDSEIMKKPQGKQQIEFNSEVLIFVLWCYGAKFASTILIAVIAFAGTLFSLCVDKCALQNCTCKYFYIPTKQLNSTAVVDWNSFSSNVLSAQNFCVIITMIQLICISVCFVHRDYSLWRKSPHNNFLWLGSLLLISLLQIIFTLVNINQIHAKFNDYMGFEIPIFVIIFCVISPLLTIGINELIKKEEIKFNLRYWRRTRLDFGTKLGMNSPF